MKKYLLLFFKCVLLWFCLFTLQRILFSIFYFSKLHDSPISEYFGVYFYSIRIDLGVASILSVLPFLFICIYEISKKSLFKKLFTIVLFVELIVVILVNCGELNAYGEWNHKLTTRVFTHLVNPDEVYRSANWKMILGFLSIFILELGTCLFLFKRFFRSIPVSPLQFSFKNLGLGVLSFAMLSSLSVLALRGGLQPIPMNINAGAYSNHAILNDISINPLYYFGNSYIRYKKGNLDGVLPKVDEAAAEAYVDELFGYDRSMSEKIFAVEKPNIVLVILEGWAADAVSCLSETKGSTPYFDEMAKKGLLFSQFYACSGTSEIGNSSILSGFPALPEISLTQQPDKYRKVPAINQDLETLGYNSSYLFGGDLKYGNIGGYLLDHNFGSVKDENDLPPVKKRGKLNYYDEDLYRFFESDLDAKKEPFLACTFTGSTHSPYDHPPLKHKKFKGREAEYMNSLVYADSVMHQFMENVKKKSWYKNTVFVFVADHGHPNEHNDNPHISGYSRIPLLIYGPALKSDYQGKLIEKIGSQADLATTLLTQLGLGTEKYPFSKDLLNPSAPGFAMHTITNGFGWVTKEGNFSYHLYNKAYMDENYVHTDKVSLFHRGSLYLYSAYSYFSKL